MSGLRVVLDSLFGPSIIEAHIGGATLNCSARLFLPNDAGSHPLGRWAGRLKMKRLSLTSGVLLACFGLASSLVALAQTQTFVLNSPNPQLGALFGRAVAMGDIDGDGIAEIAIGAPGEDIGSRVDQGRVYIFSATGELLRSLDDPNPRLSAQFGKTLSMGDVNADGKAELLVDGGEVVYLFSPDDGALIRTTPAPETSATPPFFGSALTLSDVDGDGGDDMVVGSWNLTVGNHGSAGRAYVFSGVDGSLLASLDSPTPLDGANFGRSLAAADLTGDGRPEIAVGALGEGFIVGGAYLFSGSDYSLIRPISNPTPQNGARFSEGIAMGDVNRDNLADIAVGAPLQDTGGFSDAGIAYIFDGPTGALRSTLTAPSLQVGGQFGKAIAISDADGDGTQDVLVGSPGPGGAMGFGRAYLFDGQTGELLRTFEATVSEANSYFGTSVALGDTDGDGDADVSVGAPGLFFGGPDVVIGRAYVFSGPTTSSPGRVTGGGWIDPDGVARSSAAQFGFVVGLDRPEAIPRGSLVYLDASAHLRIKTMSFSVLVIGDGVCGPNSHARVTGSALVHGVSETITVEVDDCGEPGSGADRFAFEMEGYSASALLKGGNIQIRPE